MGEFLAEVFTFLFIMIVLCLVIILCLDGLPYLFF